jgi:hypothetical protein
MLNFPPPFQGIGHVFEDTMAMRGESMAEV